MPKGKRMKENQYVDGTYLEKVKDWHAGDSPWKASKVLEIMHKHALRPESICDVGCGAGQILLELQAKLGADVRLAGYDISPQAIAIARNNESAGLKFYNSDFLTTSVPTPDLTLLLDVFEHVPDYLGFLEQLRKKTALIIFHVPLDICAREVLDRSQYMMEMRRIYGHLHCFTKETALATIEYAGYEIVDHCYTDDTEMEGMGPKGLRARTVHALRRSLYRRNPGLAASLFTHFNLLVLARGQQLRA